MPRFDPIQTNFTGGEQSPRLRGRVDLSKYQNQGRLIQNFVVQPHGGLVRRDGTRFAAEATDSSLTGRLIPFVFSTTQAYVLEFGNLTLRFYRNGAIITESDVSISAITQADPGVITTSGSHGYSDGDEVFLNSIGGMTELEGVRATVSAATATTFELTDVDGNDIDTTAYTAYTSGGVCNRIYTLTTPYATADLPNLKYAQSADILFLAHPDYAPRELSRTGHTNWTIAAHAYYDGPYLPLNSTAITLQPSHTTGTGRTLTASASLFTANDVGKWVRILRSGVWGVAKITAFNSDTNCDIDIEDDFPMGATSATKNWRMGAWGDDLGWPEVVTFHKQRLAWANTTNAPQTVWLSRAGDINKHSPTDPDTTVAADHGITYTLLSNRVNAVRWMDSEKELNIGTNGGSFTLAEASTSEPLGPDNVEANLETTRRSHPTLPVFHVDQATLFCNSNGRKVQEFVYSFEKDGKVSPNLTLLSEHITGEGLVTLGYAEEPDNVLWGARSDGLALGMTYERPNDVVAWHRHLLGGSLDGADHPAVESVAVIPTSTEAYDEVWFLVKRTINGVTRRYIEYIGAPFTDQVELEDARFTDCSALYDGAAATTISGLSYLEGETVSVLADGKIHPPKTVSGGAITLNYSASKVAVGLKYKSALRSVDYEGGSSVGSGQTKTRRIHDIGILFHRTIGGHVGVLGQDLEPLTFREGDALMGDPPELFSGAQLINFPSSSDIETEVYYETEEPTPASILALVPRVMVHD